MKYTYDLPPYFTMKEIKYDVFTMLDGEEHKREKC